MVLSLVKASRIARAKDFAKDFLLDKATVKNKRRIATKLSLAIRP